MRAYTVPPDIVHDVAVDGTPDTVPFTIPGQNAQAPLHRERRPGRQLRPRLVRRRHRLPDPEAERQRARLGLVRHARASSSSRSRSPPTGRTSSCSIRRASPSEPSPPRVYNVPADATAAGAIGSTTVNTVGTPGQNAAMTFTGTAGQRVSLTASVVSIPNSTVWIERPNGASHRAVHDRHERALHEPGHAPAERDVHRPHRPAGIRHRAHVARSRAGAGRSRLPDPRERRPGQRDRTAAPARTCCFTFTGSANQKISLVVSNSTMGSANVSILKPDGSTLVSNFSISSGSGYVDTTTLPVNGTYTIKADPVGHERRLGGHAPLHGARRGHRHDHAERRPRRASRRRPRARARSSPSPGARAGPPCSRWRPARPAPPRCR